MSGPRKHYAPQGPTTATASVYMEFYRPYEDNSMGSSDVGRCRSLLEPVAEGGGERIMRAVVNGS